MLSQCTYGITQFGKVDCFGLFLQESKNHRLWSLRTPEPGTHTPGRQQMAVPIRGA